MEAVHSPAEETKIARPAHRNQFAQFPKQSKERVNPLLSNKGSVRVSGHSTLATGPLPLTPTLLSQATVPAYLPGRRTPPLGKEKAEKKKRVLMRMDSGASNDDVSSELDSTERFNKLANLCQLPLFEIHNTMHMLREKGLDTGEDAGPGGRKGKGFHKSQTLYGTKRKGAEDMKQVLTTKQYEYFSKIHDINTDYITHVLNHREIYFQYVAMSKSNMWYLKTAEFKVMVDKLMAQKAQFKQNKAKYESTL